MGAPAKGGSAGGPSRAKRKKMEEPLTIWDKLRLWGGRAKGLPSDLAENHDYYLHGLPKK